MAHTHKYQTKEFGEVVVIVNGGWDGIAEILYKDYDKKDRKVEVPAVLLLSVGHAAAKSALSSVVIGAIESWNPDDGT